MIRLIILLTLLANCRPLPAQQPISTALQILQAGNTTLTFKTSCAAAQNGVQFIHVHENEQTAAEAAYQMLKKYGRGCFVTWQAYGDRYVNFKLGSSIYKFDPNRIYTARGRKETLTANGEYSSEADAIVAGIAAVFLKNYLNDKRLVIALHNNTDGGGLTISSFKKGGDYARDAKKVHVNKLRDPDDFFLTTDTRIFNYIKARGFNIVLQNNATVTDDGSLSVYAASKKIAYLNIEAQHGHLQEQLEMTDVVQLLIDGMFAAR